jgi:serine/threonine protein kinase
MRITAGFRSDTNLATQPMSRRAMEPLQRDLLGGRYEITSLIGRGGLTEVFAAYDHQLERVVAIKQPRGDVPGDTITSDRLRREALALATLDSPHVVTIFDVGFGDRGVFIVMQRLSGRTLDEELVRNGPVAPAHACRIARDVLSGLSAIHGSGLVHRDLKASNVLLDREDRAVLLDLGAALHPRRRPPTAPGTVLGAPGRLAPEQLEQGPLDGRVDLFQLGMLLIHLITGERTAEPSALLAMAPAMRQVIQRALSPVGNRYGSTVQMQQAIDQALAVCALDPPDPSVKKTRRWPELPRP